MGNFTTHHAEKPTDHPLRKWRKNQRPLVPLETLAEALGCTRAHLSLIEHYQVLPGYMMALKLSLLTGVDFPEMITRQTLMREAKDVRQQFKMALANRRSRQTHRKAAA